MTSTTGSQHSTHYYDLKNVRHSEPCPLQEQAHRNQKRHHHTTACPCCQANEKCPAASAGRPWKHTCPGRGFPSIKQLWVETPSQQPASTNRSAAHPTWVERRPVHPPAASGRGLSSLCRPSRKSRLLTGHGRCPCCRKGTRTALLCYDGFCQTVRVGLGVAMDAHSSQGVRYVTVMTASSPEIKPASPPQDAAPGSRAGLAGS